jgi:hypothetical protein
MGYDVMFDGIMDRFIDDMKGRNKEGLNNFLIYGDTFVHFYISYRNDIDEIIKEMD